MVWVCGQLSFGSQGLAGCGYLSVGVQLVFVSVGVGMGRLL